MPETRDVDAAILAMLAADAELAALMNDGVWFGVAPPGSTRFVRVSQAAHTDEYVFNAPASERVVYAVEAIEQSTTADRALDAAARIYAVLHDVPIVAAGYAWMNTQRHGRIHDPVIDPSDSAKIWQHCGGYYEVMIQPTA
jgi:hypothetical protein